VIYASRTVATWQVSSIGKFVQEEKDNMFEVSHNILNTWMDKYAWQAAMHTAESSVPDLPSFETETDIEH
jgi:hypothetical protein